MMFTLAHMDTALVDKSLSKHQLTGRTVGGCSVETNSIQKLDHMNP